MKYLIRIITASIVLILIACNEDISDVSGNAELEIYNVCEYEISIYFDEVHLGDIPPESTKSWSVMSGVHTVAATCQEARAYEAEHTFVDFQSLYLELDVVLKFSAGIK